MSTEVVVWSCLTAKRVVESAASTFRILAVVSPLKNEGRNSFAFSTGNGGGFVDFAAVLLMAADGTP
jgi:hypothetical protein